MGFLSCCLSSNEEPSSLTRLPDVGPEPSQAATSTIANLSPCQDSGNEPECVSRSNHPPSQLDTDLLQTLQLALAALEGGGFEERASLLTSTVLEHLGPLAVVRLYGLSTEDSESHLLHLVQLAAAAGQGVAWSQCCGEEILAGRSLTLFSVSAVGSSGRLTSSPFSTMSSGYTSGLEGRGDPHMPLLEIAMCSKKPAILSLDSLATSTLPKGGSIAASAIASGSVAQQQIPASPFQTPGGSVHPTLPRDCAAELNATICYPRLGSFAAVPLMYGKRLMGALWIAVAAPTHDNRITTRNAANTTTITKTSTTAAIDVNSQLRCVGSAPSDPASPAKGSWLEQAARSQTLLGNTAALGQLGVSTSMALALAAGGDIDYISWLATCVRRLASCATLHTLIAGVCSILSKHVRLRFHADVAVQTALVPEADSTVAFMLCPETKPAGGGPVPGGIGGGLLALFPKVANGRDVVPEPSNASDQQAARPKSGIISKPSRKPVRRVASQALLQPDSAATAIDTNGATSAARHFTTTRSSTMGLLIAQGTGGGGLGTAHSPASQHGRRSRDRTADPADGSYATRAARSPAGPTSATSAPVLYMSAKAFQLSQTLLSRLVSNAVAHRPPLQVPVGVIVPDTARHVADVRQPSRDVCMLIGAKGSMAGSIWQQSGAPGGFSGFADQSGSRCGPASLVLLAMEVAEGGCMLALYVAFPNLMPQPLLAAARESCEQLLRQMLVALVRHKLQTSELGPDLDTLRAGVPGSYISVSRVRDHIDQLQLPMASLSSTPPPPPPLNSITSERLGLHRTQRTQQDLEAHLDRMSVWNTGPGTTTGSIGGGGGPIESLGAIGSRTNGQGSWRGNQPQHSHPHHQGNQDVDSFNVESPTMSVATREDARARIGISPLPAAKLLLARGSSSHQPQAPTWGPELRGGETYGYGNGGGSGGPTSAAQFYVSTHGVTSVRTASGASGLPSCTGVASQGAMSTVMLDSNAEGQEGRFAQAAMMTVHGVDDTWGMRGMMGALVESIMTTLKVGASELVEETSNGAELGSLRSMEGLEDLHLAEVLGHGASGVVLRGMLGTVPVAVKLMEMLDADYDVLSTEVGLALAQVPLNDNDGCGQIGTDLDSKDLLEEPLVKSLASMAPSGTSAKLMRGQQVQPVNALPDKGDKENRESSDRGDVGDRKEPQHQQEVQGKQYMEKQQQHAQQQGPGPGPGAGMGDGAAFARQRQVGRQQTESEQLRARRNMLRNATELAVMRMVSHVCIVQAFAVYDNVIMERPPDAVDSFVLRRLDPKNPDTGGSPICTAIVQELCDCGSLADVLSDHSFPNVICRPAVGSPAGASTRVPGYLVERSLGSRMEIEMKGVYLTLLEIALALKHLHSRRLVHRDVKPANILLKTSPGDPRGWTCKLADFGFALVLDQQDKGTEGKDESSINPSGGSTGGRSSWYTLQAQASGTVTHMAPEAVVKNGRIDASVDIYALGIIAWELVCGRGQRPFHHLDPGAIPAAVAAGMRPIFTAGVPAPYRKMAQACLAQEPHRRPRAADVVSFIKSQLAVLS
ncbi:hypothetical protein Vafri_22007 [Volvox africanus]|uniref:Protein kinase domain-containing protein n=1 Tax=Volvox africanus TaxID=51714 RepID=A0A8J4C029_9CHLO|nr:hypothetical protein Vafri_22007 [Volvox africanus]